MQTHDFIALILPLWTLFHRRNYLRNFPKFILITVFRNRDFSPCYVSWQGEYSRVRWSLVLSFKWRTIKRTLTFYFTREGIDFRRRITFSLSKIATKPVQYCHVKMLLTHINVMIKVQTNEMFLLFSHKAKVVYGIKHESLSRVGRIEVKVRRCRLQ